MTIDLLDLDLDDLQWISQRWSGCELARPMHMTSAYTVSSFACEFSLRLMRFFCCKSLYVLRSLLCLGRNSWAVSSETKVCSERWINYCSAVINEPQARRARDNPINICYYAQSRDTPYSVSSKLSPPINPANSTKGVEFYSTHSDKWSYDIVHRTRPISI